jgi:hypothetical protein
MVINLHIPKDGTNFHYLMENTAKIFIHVALLEYYSNEAI